MTTAAINQSSSSAALAALNQAESNLTTARVAELQTPNAQTKTTVHQDYLEVVDAAKAAAKAGVPQSELANILDSNEENRHALRIENALSQGNTAKADRLMETSYKGYLRNGKLTDSPQQEQLFAASMTPWLAQAGLSQDQISQMAQALSTPSYSTDSSNTLSGYTGATLSTYTPSTYTPSTYTPSTSTP